jgi:hypothetical protein
MEMERLGRRGKKRAAAPKAVYHNVIAGSPGHEQIDGALLLAGWFRRHPAEKEMIQTPAAARAACGSRQYLLPAHILKLVRRHLPFRPIQHEQPFG